MGAFGVATAGAAENDNLALGKTATASSYEVASTSPDKAVDGNASTRWGTAQNKAADEWLNVDLGGTKTVRQVNIDFERDDAAQNILGYKVELKENGNYTTVHTTDEKAKQHEVVALDQDHQASDVKVTILKADGGTMNWVNVGINELRVYSKLKVDAIATPNVNHMLGATMTASSFEEGTTFTADKAADDDTNTRWASDYSASTGQWIQGAFTKPTVIKDIQLTFHTRNVDPIPSNVESFKLSYTDEDGNEQVLNAKYDVPVTDGKRATQIHIQLDAAVTATALKLSNFVANASSWNNLSIVEWAAYSNDQDLSVTLDSVVASVEANTKTIAADVATLPGLSLPTGFSYTFNGADYEQIIAKDGTINHPLTDKTVNVSYTITNDANKKSKSTADIAYTVKGTKTQAEGKNEKPTVIPEIADWYTESTDKLPVKSVTAVTYDDDSLKAVVDEFVADYKDFTGTELTATKGEAKANAFNFSKVAADTAVVGQLGDEGYTMDIKADRIDVKSVAVTGDMYAMQTILQMTKQDAENFSVGQIRDYPRFTTRGFVLDMARKPISLSMVKQITRTMRYYKMNDFQAHLSDNYIFLENYGKKDTEDEAWKAYDAFRLESGLTNDKGESPTAEDYSISKKDFHAFIQSERALGMNVVPEIDVPAHAISFTKVWPELAVKGKVSPINANRPLIDHIDVSKPEAIAKIKEIFDDYTKGDDPTFDADTTVHIGADEFLDNYTAYREFVNDIVPYVKATNKVRMWGGLTWINDGKTEITEDAIKNVEMNLWSSGWADGKQMYDMGYKLINTIDSYGYMVPNGGYGRGSYGDLLNVTDVFNNFAANRVGTKSGWQYVPSSSDQMLGAAFAIWNDNIDKHASGLTESDEYWRFFDALPVYAEKTWAATGKEKGTAAKLQEIAQQQGTGPRTNPYYDASADKNGKVESYNFADTADKSENGRDLTIADGSTAKVADGALKIGGKNSYATTPVDQLGNGNELSFDITLNSPAKPGDILFEADAPYYTHDIRVMNDGKLGFTRELYDYSFDYSLPVGKKVNITIAVSQQKAKLYVDGQFVSDATGQFVDKGIVKKTNITNATFALPLQRIGSKTQAIDATIDNVVARRTAAATDEFNKSCWTGTANTETQYNETEGLFKYAFDGKSNTIWHSNWQGASDKLTGSNSFYGEIDMCQAYTINQFSFTPRVDKLSGAVTKADLFVKENEGDEWKPVAADQTFAADQSTKTFHFEAQKVRYVKFVAKQSNDGWVAVSEFNVANRPATTVRVYAEASPAEGGTVSATAEGAEAGAAGATATADVTSGTAVTLKATAKDGYTFAGWYNTLSETAVSTDATYTLDANANTALIAKFTKGDEPGPETKPVTKVEVTGEDTVTVGNTTTLTATITPADATDKTLTWSTSDETVATVSDAGVVTGVAAGKATITATAANGVKGSLTVTVKAKEPETVPVTKVEVTGKDTLTEGDTTTLTAKVTPADATDKSLTWSSSDKAVATVNADGKVTAVKAGKTTITATAANGVKGSLTVTVKAKDVTPETKPVTKVEVTGDDTVTVGDTIKLAAKITPADATDQSLTWTSTDEKIATVDAKGVVTGVAAGKATIAATAANGVKGTLEVTVKAKEVTPETKPVTGVKVTGKNELTEGDTTTLQAEITPADATDKSLTWTSSDKAVATVNADGKVTALKAGTTTITATASNGVKGSLTITVKAKEVTPEPEPGNVPVTKVEVTVKDGVTKVEAGKKLALTATVLPGNATNKTVTWTTSDASIATVDTNGIVTALKAGTVTITATAADGSEKSGSIQITVTSTDEGKPEPGKGNGVAKTGAAVTVVAMLGALLLACGVALNLRKARR
nr:Ig-like domain-containing protein [Bifidobacterium leontopitheci]